MLWLPLRLRLALVTTVLSSLTMVGLSLVLYRGAEANLLRELDSRLVALAEQLGERLAQATSDPAVGGGEPPTLLEQVVAPGIVAKLVTPDGRVQLVSARQSPALVPDDAALIAARRAGQTTGNTVYVAPGAHVRLMSTALGNSQSPNGVLVVGASLTGIRVMLANLRTMLLLTGMLTVGLIAGGVALVMGPRLRALSRLTRLTADVVATGNYQTRVTLPTRRDDIYQLAATINALISAVQRTLDQQRQFLAFTSHELRSPLTVILANLDLLKRELAPAERDICVMEAMEEARRMRRLINDLLLLAEKDSTRVVERIPLRLDSLIEETVTIAARQSETHTVRVAVESPVVVAGDAERLMQIVRNLVENALTHTPAGTVVEVRLEQVDGYAHITVADTGPGIAPEHLPHLWDRFYRVDKAQSRVKGSTGLGLPIVEYIAEAHSGSVTVASTPGQGTTFTVLLPLAVEDPRVAPTPGAPGIG